MNSHLALGMIETIGLIGAIEAADAAVKAAQVEVSNYEQIQGGIVSVHFRGDIGSVQAATDAGAQAARRIGQLFAVHVIPAPVTDIDEVIYNMESAEK